MPKTKWYVGVIPGGEWTAFRADCAPTYGTHGDRFGAVIGPFRTRRGAVFMAKYGRGNPHLQAVADAERLAKSEESRNV